MYSALVELMRPEIDEAIEKTWDEATAKKTIEAIENAMKKLGMSEKEACAFMDTTEAEYNAYKQLVENSAGKVNIR